MLAHCKQKTFFFFFLLVCFMKWIEAGRRGCQEIIFSTFAGLACSWSTHAGCKAELTGCPPGSPVSWCWDAGRQHPKQDHGGMMPRWASLSSRADPMSDNIGGEQRCFPSEVVSSEASSAAWCHCCPWLVPQVGTGKMREGKPWLQHDAGMPHP